ncbi:MAG: ABC1 kinase family protein [Alphaproteobacteria bacterium]
MTDPADDDALAVPGERVMVFRRPHGRPPDDVRREREEELRPTPLQPGAPAMPVVIRPLTAVEAHRSLTVIWRFLKLFATIQWWRLTSRYTHAKAALLLRGTLQDLGGLWIKVGQLMSLRTDVLPEEICRDLARLQSRAEGFDPDAALRTVEQELGCPIGRVFRRLDREPLAAASMAQGHFGVLRETGEAVLVKVQRPGIEDSFRRDLRLLGRIVGFLRYFSIAQWMQFDDLMWEIGEIMREEADYRYEATNLKRLRANLRNHDVMTPIPILPYCTQRLMVMTFVPGVAMSDYIALLRTDPRRAQQWLNENEIDPEDVAARLISSLLRQVFEENLFHGDLHPGNIMLLRGGEIALIDFGTAGTLEKQFLDIYQLAVASIVERNYRRASDYILAMCNSVPSANIGAVRDEMVRAFRAWEMRSNLHNASYFERALSTANTEVNRILARHRIQPSWSLLKLGRTLGTLDATLSVLVPNGDIRRFYVGYFREAAQRARTPGAVARKAARQLHEISMTMREVRLLMVPYLRSRTLAVRGAVDRITLVTSLFLRYLRLGVMAVAITLIFHIIDHEYLGAARGSSPDHVFSWLPQLSTGNWLILIACLFILARVLRRASAELRPG